MHLIGSFVDDNYEVVKLFDHTIGNPFPDLQYIYDNKTVKRYNLDYLSEKLCVDPQIKLCIENFYEIWNKRTTHLSKVAQMKRNR